MARVLLDTTAYVDLQRAPTHRRSEWARNAMRRASVEAARGKLGLSPLGVMEITAGLEEPGRAVKRRAFLDQVLPMFEIVPYGPEEAALGGEIYARLEVGRQRIGIVDTAIAATAIVRDLTLVTSNSKHFERVLQLGYSMRIENWREP